MRMAGNPRVRAWGGPDRWAPRRSDVVKHCREAGHSSDRGPVCLAIGWEPRAQ